MTTIGLSAAGLSAAPAAIPMASATMAALTVRLTAVMHDLLGAAVPYTPGALTWTSDNAQVPLVDTRDGSATVHALAASKTATILCYVTKTLGTADPVGAGLVLTTPASQVVTLSVSPSTVKFTAVGQKQQATVSGIDQYGVVS